MALTTLMTMTRALPAVSSGKAARSTSTARPVQVSVTPGTPRRTAQQWAVERAALRRRMRRLGVRYEDVAGALGVPLSTLGALFAGQIATNKRLGGEHWPEAIHAFLDQYAQSLALLAKHLERAQRQIAQAGLPCPALITRYSVYRVASESYAESDAVEPEESQDGEDENRGDAENDSRGLA